MNRDEYAAMYRVEDTLWWYVGMRRVGESLLGGRLQPGIRILDAGCGTGGNMRWLARFGAVWGIDLSPEAVSFCRERGLRTVSRGSVTAMPFPDASFDLVTSFDVIYHLGVSSDTQALREVHRVLRPGGAALIRVPAIDALRSAHDAAVHTRQRYSLRELRAACARAGLHVRRGTYANTLLFPLAAAARLFARVRSGVPARGEETPGSGDAGNEGRGHRSDVRPAHPLMNAVGRLALDVEAALLSHWALPIGLSALVVVERPERASTTD